MPDSETCLGPNMDCGRPKPCPDRLEPATADRCVWCHRLGHAADEHPLPKDHPQYDAFYDATDDELGAILSTAIRPGMGDARPNPSGGEAGA